MDLDTFFVSCERLLDSRLVGKLEDWKEIFNYLGKSDLVKIEIEKSERGSRGKIYHRKELQSFSLIAVSLKSFFQDKSDEEISNSIIEFGFDI